MDVAIHRWHLNKVAISGAMTGNNPTDRRSKLGIKRHVLIDKKGIPLSFVITTVASPHNIKAITDVIDNAYQLT